MWTLTFWKAAAERAAKTTAQGAIVILGGGVGLLNVQWGPALLGLFTLTASSLLTSIVSAGVGDPSSPSLLTASAGRHEL